MSINEILAGNFSDSYDEQEDALNEMKSRKFEDLNNSEKDNLIEFLSEKADVKLAIDYLNYVLDEQVSLTDDDDELKYLFNEKRIKKMMVDVVDMEKDIDIDSLSHDKFILGFKDLIIDLDRLKNELQSKYLSE